MNRFSFTYVKFKLQVLLPDVKQKLGIVVTKRFSMTLLHLLAFFSLIIAAVYSEFV